MDIPTHYWGFEVGRKYLCPSHLYAFVASLPGFKSDGVGDLGVAITFDNSVFTKPARDARSRVWTAYDGNLRVLDLQRYRVSRRLRSELASFIEGDGSSYAVVDQSGGESLVYAFRAYGQDWWITFRLSPIEGLEGVKMAVTSLECGRPDPPKRMPKKLSHFAVDCVRRECEVLSSFMDRPAS